MAKFSLVIRCYNEEQHIGRLLSGIIQQTLTDPEIIIVDSGSTDATVSIASRYPVKILSITPEEFSFGRALNIGCRAATGDIIVIASAHVYPLYFDWLENLLTPFERPEVALVYGQQRGNEITKYSEHQVFAKWFPHIPDYNQTHPFCNFDLLIHLSYSQFTVKRKEDLLYIFDNKDSEFLEGEPNWIDFSVMPNTTYSLEGKIASESFPSTENALVQCKFMNEKGEVLPPLHAAFSIIETDDSYQYIPIPINNSNGSKFSIQFKPPHQAVSAKMGFRRWNSRSKIIIASQIKIFSSKLTPQKPNSYFIISTDNFTEALYRQVEQKKHYFKHPPFFIIGSGRCGTTLMRRILQSHSEVIIPDENYTIYKSYKIFKQSISWGEKVELTFLELMKQDSYQHLDLFPLIKCLSKLEGEEQRLDNIWNCFHWFYSKVYNKKVTRWGDKTPLNIFHLDPVISIFPNAKFICLVRNAYDVSASYASMKGREGKVQEGLDRWIKSNFCVFQFLFRHPSSVHFVKYEDLVTNPQAEVQKVCQFISLDFQASMIEKVDTAKTMTDVLLHEHLNNVKKEIFTDSVGKGVKAIPEKMKDELDKKAKMWHDLFGYSF